METVIESHAPLKVPPGARTVVLARHGRTAENAAGRILGRRDPPLDQVGMAQAQALAETVRGAPLAAVWTSPLQRALRTAEIAGAALGLTPTVLDTLIESDRGAWEGQSLADINRASPDLYAAFLAADRDFAFPGGESLADQVRRTCRALADIAAGPLPALVVAHVGTIRAALLAFGHDVPPESDIGHASPLYLPASTCRELREP